eukprot:g1662.t1
MRLTVAEEDLEQLLMKPPYDNYDSFGKRVLKNYQAYGDSAINENFVRLTPDRQSKEGWLFSKSKIGTSRFSLVFRVRLSGQGKSLFGDGLTIFLTDRSNPFGGRFDSKDIESKDFNGFALVLDTFKNPESLIRGTKDTMTFSKLPSDEREGCDADIRFFEGRDDFSASKSNSYLRIQFKQEMYSGGYLQVDYDARGTGDWQHCFTMKGKVVDKSVFDVANAYVAINAHTGQLADNHDLLSVIGHGLNTFERAPTFLPGTDGERTSGDEKISGAQLDNMSSEEIIDLIFKKVEVKLEKKLRQLKTDIEHQIVGLAEGLTNAIKKLSAQESKDHTSIVELERKIFGKVRDSVTTGMENEMDGLRRFISKTKDELESDQRYLKEGHKDLHEKVKEAASSGGGLGSLSFWFIMLMFAGFGGFVIFKMRQLEKKHFL